MSKLFKALVIVGLYCCLGAGLRDAQAEVSPITACHRLKLAIIKLNNLVQQGERNVRNISNTMTGRQRAIFLSNARDITKTHRRERAIKRERYLTTRNCLQFCYSIDDPDAPFRLRTGIAWVSAQYFCSPGWNPGPGGAEEF